MNEQWRNAKEMVPALGQKVLIAYGPGYFQLVQFVEIDCANKWVDLDRLQEYAPTHWMPLPEPPKRQSSFEAWYLNWAMPIRKDLVKAVWDAAVAASKSPDFVP